MALEVRVSPVNGRYHTLEIYDGKMLIGEYERSITAEVERKKGEIMRAERLLREAFQRSGRFVVRWSGANRRKEIRSENGTVIGTIPREMWGKPGSGK